MTYKTVVRTYSLEKDEVGKTVGEVEVKDYPDGLSALLALDKELERPSVKGRDFQFQIEMPDGRRLAFDDVYTEVFGERPVKRDGKVSLYPKLKRAS